MGQKVSVFGMSQNSVISLPAISPYVLTCSRNFIEEPGPDHHTSAAREGAEWPLHSVLEEHRPSGDPDLGQMDPKNVPGVPQQTGPVREVLGAGGRVQGWGENQEVQNTSCCALQENFHAVV